MKSLIKDIIIVEGKDDVAKVKAAIDAEVISTNGFGYKKKFISDLKKISERQGIIIFTDPDFVGEQIRKDLSKHIKNCKHAFLPQNKSTKKGDIGIENASEEDIRKAILKAKPKKGGNKEIFTRKDLLEHKLLGSKDSKERRDKLGDILGIGYCNAKQFLSRLNSFNINRKEFLKGVELIEKEK